MSPHPWSYYRRYSPGTIQRWVNTRYDHVSATLDDGRIFVCGGRYNLYETYEKGLEWIGVYNPNNFTWRRLQTTGDIPRSGTQSATAQIIDDDMFVFCHDGGDTALDYEDEDYYEDKHRCDVYALNVKTLVWRKMPVEAKEGEETRPHWNQRQVSWIRAGDEIVLLSRIQSDNDMVDDENEYYDGKAELAVYRTKEHTWFWPRCFGGQIPKPEVAIAVGEATAYIFGHVGDYRQHNRLYRIDEYWNVKVLLEQSEEVPTRGRTLTLLKQNEKSLRAILTGEYGSGNWILEVCGEDDDVRWTHYQHLDEPSDTRRGHSAALETSTGQVLVIGGVSIRHEYHTETWLTVSPVPLQIQAMETVRKELEKLRIVEPRKLRIAERECRKEPLGRVAPFLEYLTVRAKVLEEQLRHVRLKIVNMELKMKLRPLLSGMALSLVKMELLQTKVNLLRDKKEVLRLKWQVVEAKTETLRLESSYLGRRIQMLRWKGAFKVEEMKAAVKKAGLEGRMREHLPAPIRKSLDGYVQSRCKSIYRPDSDSD